MTMTNADNCYSQFAETLEICGKFAAYHTNVVNYVPCKANSEKTANFSERKEVKNGK
jgi:hypothetical protein